LGETLLSEKKSSRRRRKTFGNEDSGTESRTESLSEASAGARSLISAVRLMDLVSGVIYVTPTHPPRHNLPPGGGSDRPQNPFSASVSKL